MTSTEAREAVVLGIDYLNRVLVSNWHLRVNIARIQQASSTDCVIAQLFGNLATARTRLGLWRADGRPNHAFEAEHGLFQYTDDDGKWSRIWREELKKIPTVGKGYIPHQLLKAV